MKTKKLETTYVKIEELRPSIYNPRIWRKKAINDLTKSIKTYGLVDAILCNSAPGRENIIISGHFRLSVAKKLGYKKVPVCYVNIPDIKKEKALNLTLNKVGGDWDMALLKEFDIDMLLDTGFESGDLTRRRGDGSLLSTVLHFLLFSVDFILFFITLFIRSPNFHRITVLNNTI